MEKIDSLIIKIVGISLNRFSDRQARELRLKNPRQ